jgi:transcription antitermination factor NusG
MARRRDKPKMTKAKAYKPKVTIVNGRTRTETKNPPPSDLDLDPKTKWYLVYTAPRMEAKAKQALEDAGCKTFWPSSHVVITAPRRKPVEHDVGTFPRYLFVSGMPFRERQIDRVQEDRTVVTVNGRPVDDIRDIDGVLEVVSNSAGYQASKIEERRAPTVRPGDKARVIEGPFMSFQATVVEAIGMDAAKVLIDIFGGKVPVTMPLAQLDAA